jgi:polysaccharide export outer membrane protein
VDLQKYQLTGDLKSNPTLLDGDVIVVPTEQQEVGRIRIEGSVKAPAEFEYVVGDRVRDILAMAHGFAIDADSSKIELVRFTKNSFNLSRQLLNLDFTQPSQREEVLNTLLQPDDRLFVRPKAMYHEKKDVEVTGRVKYPGFYALENDTTRLSQIIKLAGGFTPDASLVNSYVQRRSHSQIRDAEFERLQSMSVADMTEMERDYFKVKSRELVGSMGVNFIQLFEKGDSTQDAILMDNDLINIPAQELTVNVSGQVIKPGLFPYKEGGTLNYYIKEAGGYNWNARRSKVRIIKARTGEWMRPKGDTILDIGDTVFVPEKPERNYWVLVRDIITVVAQVATIYYIVVNQTK